jgi:excisionase family DNA binding protein
MVKESPIMTLDEVAKYLQVSKKSVRQAVKDGQIHMVKIRSSWRFHRAAVDALFAGQKLSSGVK